MAARKKKPPEPAPEEPEAPPPEEEIIETLVWEGITIQARYRPDYIGTAHLELHVLDPPKAPIPVTDTGYRSHFHQRGEVEAAGGPAAYTKAWLDHEAKGRVWRAMQIARSKPQQLDLFG